MALIFHPKHGLDVALFCLILEFGLPRGDIRNRSRIVSIASEGRAFDILRLRETLEHEAER